VLVGAEPAELFLDALGVVPAVDVVEDRGLGFVAGASGVAIDEFDLQGGEDVIHERVVVGVADRAHRRAGFRCPPDVARSGWRCRWWIQLVVATP